MKKHTPAKGKEARTSKRQSPPKAAKAKATPGRPPVGIYKKSSAAKSPAKAPSKAKAAKPAAAAPPSPAPKLKVGTRYRVHGSVVKLAVVRSDGMHRFVDPDTGSFKFFVARNDLAAEVTPYRPDNVPDLEAHELAGLLPAMTPEDFDALKADIAAAGQRDPIVLLDGKILDGRHRYRACRELGITPVTRDFDPATEGSPVSYIYSKALHRNLNDSQKACAAARIEPHFAALAAARRAATLKQYQDKADERITPGKRVVVFGVPYIIKRVDLQRDVIVMDDRGEETDIPLDRYCEMVGLNTPPSVPEPNSGTAGFAGEAREQAAALFGVSGRYVSDAKALMQEAPELFEQAFGGTVPLSTAIRQHRTNAKGSGAASPSSSPEQLPPFAGKVLEEFDELLDEFCERMSDRHAVTITTDTLLRWQKRRNDARKQQADAA